jgi:hypothetical protein
MVYCPVYGEGGKPAMRERAEQFRKNAEECNRLAVHIKNPEHKALAAEFAAAWLALAQAFEKRLTALQPNPRPTKANG